MIAPELASLRTLVYERLDRDELSKSSLEKLLRAESYRVDLAWSLRHHREKPITKRSDLDFREGVDRLCALYSLLEIGCYARAFPDPLPADLRRQTLEVLTRAMMRNYYEQDYPLELVKRFRRRLRDEQHTSVSESDAARAQTLYRLFLDIDRQIADDEDVQTFLWMLDDMWWNDVGLPNLVRACKTPKRFGEALAGSKGVEPKVESAARGLVEYLSFAIRLDELLKEAAPIKMLAEHFWLYYTYWFHQIGKKVGRDLNGILKTFETWPGAPKTMELRAVVNRLLTGPEAYQEEA